MGSGAMETRLPARGLPLAVAALPCHGGRALHVSRGASGRRACRAGRSAARGLAARWSRPGRALVVRSVAFSDSEDAAPETARNPFVGYAPEPDGLQRLLGGTGKTTLLIAAALAVGASGYLGNLLGSQAPAAQRLAARVAGGLLGAGAAALGAKALLKKREGAALLELYQLLARQEDLAELSGEDVRAIGAKYGVDLAAAFVPEVKAVYDTFVEAAIPVQSPLSGEEADKIGRFKQALGLSNEDAAAAHIDVGRRFLRLANEAGGKGAKAEYRKALNKLIYVSGLVFGAQQEAFLLPWKRVCDYNDATLYVAKRDQAKALFRSHLDSLGAELPADRASLVALREFQQRVRLEDGIADEVVRESARAHVEARLEKAIECMKRRTRVRDYSDLVREVQAVVDYSKDLEELAADPEVPRGLGKVTVYGGKLEAENKTRELRDVFRIYLEEQLRAEREMSEALEDEMAELQQILGLGKKEAGDIISETTSKVYRALLREEVTSGRLDAAASKAEVLAGLCERLGFDPDAAAALHRQLYRQKLDSLLEKKRLTEEDAAELDRQRRLLCIKKADVRQLHRETCGRIYSAAVEDALNAGHERFTNRDREAVLQCMRDVRLDPALAKELLASTVRKAFLAFVSRSRNKANRLEAAKELKALVFFSNMVVTPLLADINDVLAEGEAATKEAATKELAEIMIKAREEAEKAEQAEAAAAAAALGAEPAAAPGEAAAPAPAAEAAASGDAAAPAPAEASEAAAAAAPAPAAAPAAAAEAGSESDGEGELPETLKKSQTGRKKEEERASSSGKGRNSQSEITLAADLDARDRTDIYRSFLLYCMSGNVVSLPMGTSIQVMRDEDEFTRLSQLGDILGLTQMDVYSVHTGLAEQAYRQQVQQAMAGGGLSAERVAELEELRQKFGLSQESAQKIIRGAQNQGLIANMNAAKASGGLTLQRLLDMEAQGIAVKDVTSDEMRASLYTKEMADALSAGTGDFDRAYFTEELPARLGIKERRVRAALDALAKDRKRTTLVQAISYLRQKKLAEAAKALNNLLACHKALPSGEPESWQAREELLDLWSVYATQEADAGKQAELARVLALSDAEVSQLRGVIESGQFRLAEEAAEDDGFF